MSTHLSTLWFYKPLIIIILILPSTYITKGQTIVPDSLKQKVDTISDTGLKTQKSNKSKKINLSTEAKYEAEDSIIMDKRNEMAYLYHNASVIYEGIVLKAEYIELDFKNNTVYAIGIPDSTGKIIGSPVFKDHGDEYNASVIRYNFDTQKGLISDVKKSEGEVYVWIQKGKKMKNNITYVESGHFTTCSADHPHYRVKFWKGKIIPNDKIVTGPIYMEIEDIPIPVIIPFGFIPNTKGRSNGILPPTFNYTENRGYGLTRGGYYWGLGEHFDLALRGDIYSRGSWGLNAASRYNFRYKGSGSIDVSYTFNKYGETDTKGQFNEDKTYFIRWQHRQDPKSNPYSSFSANVNFGSTEYNKLNSTNSNDYLRNTFQSSISYNARIGNGYNFTGSLNHSQNSQTGAINMTLPQLAFSTPRFTPFSKKNSIGKKRWYEKISLSYKMDAKNAVNTVDSLFKTLQFEDFDKAIQHTIPLSNTVPIGNFTWTNSINLKERWYFQSTSKYYETDTTYSDGDTIVPHLITNKNNGFYAVHEFNYSSSLNTRIYGMYMFTKGPIMAMRHVLTPNLSFSYRPDFGTDPFNYYKEYTNQNGDTIRYSMFEGQMYGSPPDGKSGSIGLYFDNNIEIKIRSRKDTITGTKKIKILDNLRFGTSYNLAATEFALAPLSLTARTNLYKGLSIRYAGYWDFYGLDSTGQRVNEFNWNLGKRILRKKSGDWNLSFNYRISSNNRGRNKKYKSDKGTKEELKEINDNPEGFVDFNNAWNLDLNYTLRYTRSYNTTQLKIQDDIIQTLGLRGSINITKKWKVGVTTGWDFQANDLSYTSIDIYRDLHCWEMLFNWIPIGPRKSYNFTLRVKSPMLQDLKINRTRNWRDY